MNAFSRRWKLFVLGAAVVGCFAAAPPADKATSPSSKPLAPTLFQRWPEKKPDLVIVLTGQQHSYLKFCGCSDPQFGGFERRFNFVAKLKDKGWPVVALDLGDIVEKKTSVPQQQTVLKYKIAMKALNQLDYKAMGLGLNELNLPLFAALSEFTLQNPKADPKVLTANIDKDYRANNLPSGDGQGSMVKSIAIIDAKPAIGVTCALADSVTGNVHDKNIKFDPYATALPHVIQILDEKKIPLRVLLFQGNPTEAVQAATQFPQFQIVQCLCPEEEPPIMPTMVGNSMIVTTGHKARYVGVVGVFKSDDPKKPWQLHYESVKLDDSYETDPNKVSDHPILKLLDEYAVGVRDGRWLSQYPKADHPVQAKNKGLAKAKFVDEGACKTCHAQEYAIWEKSGHAHAFDTLVNKAKKPSLRQFDGECVQCHVIGFQYTGGYVDEAKTPQLKNVGCQNCHGPGSAHVADKGNLVHRANMSPWKTKPADRVRTGPDQYDNALLLRINDMCAKCHDPENDPHFKFEKYWPKIEHGKGAKLAGK